MLPVIGLDIAKRVFQLHTVDSDTGEITKLKLKRSEIVPFFSNRSVSVVAMEACGSSHHWARQLRSFGHEVRLIATKFVKPFVKGNKNDAADARAIWEAAQRPEMRCVAVKSEAQQAILALHSMREGLVKARTAQLHQLRAVFYELGIDLPEVRHWCVKRLPEAFAGLEGRVPAMVIEALRDQFQLITQLTERVESIEHKLDWFRRSDERCQRLLEIPGVGLLTATAVVASVGDATEFRSGREFAAWLGVVPRHSGTGGRVRILNISKRVPGVNYPGRSASTILAGGCAVHFCLFTWSSAQPGHAPAGRPVAGSSPRSSRGSSSGARAGRWPPPSSRARGTPRPTGRTACSP